MIIDIARLLPAGSRYTGEEPPEVLDLGEQSELVSPDGPLKYDLYARIVTTELLVQGVVSMRLRFRCSRCGDTFCSEVRDPAFFHSRDVSGATDSADLTADIREAILLGFPSYPVCREECQGVCPQCGANRNRGSCRCKPASDSRWGALDKLQDVT
jgi:uncharacterized protein